jgi:hypothetical protein
MAGRSGLDGASAGIGEHEPCPPTVRLAPVAANQAASLHSSRVMGQPALRPLQPGAEFVQPQALVRDFR